jgi:hypothetical protein
MRKKLTITLDAAVYRGLHRVVGRRRIAHFIEDLVAPCVLKADLDRPYREMAHNEQAEREALAWADGMIGDVPNEPW